VKFDTLVRTHAQTAYNVSIASLGQKVVLSEQSCGVEISVLIFRKLLQLQLLVSKNELVQFTGMATPFLKSK
jgi:hypothetical protein